LSTRQQDITASEDGCDLKKLGVPLGLENHYAAFARQLALSQYEADQMLDEGGARLSKEIEEFCKAGHAALKKENDAQSAEEQIEAYSGWEKVKPTMETMDNLFESIKTRI
jgi:hypothetical protein